MNQRSWDKSVQNCIDCVPKRFADESCMPATVKECLISELKRLAITILKLVGDGLALVVRGTTTTSSCRNVAVMVTT